MPCINGEQPGHRRYFWWTMANDSMNYPKGNSMTQDTGVTPATGMTPATDRSARQIAGSLIMIRMPGTSLDEDSARFLRDNKIRAICLFRQNMVDPQQLSTFTADLRAVMGPHALIALDQEGGAVVRATWLPAPPAAMALGAADDLDLAREVGAAVARGVRSLGFNWNFAPVLDLNNNLDNPVIAERSFGADPKRATALALAWMEGSLSEGVACCVKHAPGHGDTHVDSHLALPQVDKPRSALEALEFSPFQQAAASAPAMMTAHITYPALDPVYPASLSHQILTGLMRGEWNYDGVIITDSLDMQAIAERYSAGDAAVRALLAGADMMMTLGDRAMQQASIDALARAIEAGQIDGVDLAKRSKRLNALAERYPCAPSAYSTETEDSALMRSAWQRGLTSYRDPQRPGPGARLRLVVRADVVSDGVSDAGVSAAQLAELLGRRFDVATTTFANAAEFDWNSLPQDGRFVLLASTSRLRYGPSERASFRPDLHLALWNPFQALDIAAPALMTYGFAPAALGAALAWLCNEQQATGSNPCLA
jgi:beta-N-acetylhexosaminidase